MMWTEVVAVNDDDDAQLRRDFDEITADLPPTRRDVRAALDRMMAEFTEDLERIQDYQDLDRALSPEVQQERLNHIRQQARLVRRRMWRRTVGQLLRLPAIAALGGMVGAGVQMHLLWLVALAAVGAAALVAQYILDEF